MSKELKRKFGVKRIGRWSLDLLCRDCGRRAGLHYGSTCPTVNLKTAKPFTSTDITIDEKENHGNSSNAVH